MDDALKVFAKPSSWPDPDPLSGDPQSQPQDQPQDQSKAQPDADPSEVTTEPGKSTKAKALDRWFREQCDKKNLRKWLNVPNEVLVSTGGPLRMKGNIKLIAEDGSITHTNQVNLCRCGASKDKPVCDEGHLEIEFLDLGNVQQASDWKPMSRPQTLTVTCIRNGPLKFRGYLRIYNKKGQECISMGGALCRCGKSVKKPFCDGSGGCVGG